MATFIPKSPRYSILLNDSAIKKVITSSPADVFTVGSMTNTLQNIKMFCNHQIGRRGFYK